MARARAKTRRLSSKSGKGASPPAGTPAPARRKSRKKGREKLIRIDLTFDQKLDIVGVLLAVAGGLILLTLLPGSRGALTDAVLRVLRGFVGWGVYPLPFGLIALGVWLLVRHFGERLPRIPPEQVLGLLLAWLASLPTMHLLSAWYWVLPPERIAELGEGGGYLGLFFQQTLTATLDTAGTVVALIAWWLIAVALTLGTSIAALLLGLVRGLGRLARRAPGGRPAAGRPAAPAPQIIGGSAPAERALSGGRGRGDPERGPRPLPLPLPAGGEASAQAGGPAARGATPGAQPAAGQVAAGQPAAGQVAAGQPAAGQVAAGQAAAAFPGALIIGDQQPWELPATADILEEGASLSTNDEFDRERANVIQETLASFGVPVTVMGFNRGPAITQFEVKPGFIEGRGGKTTKVKVSRIASLADDLALALAAPSIRIEAPIPGRDVVGVEVPNERIEVVALRDVLESEAFSAINSPLAIGLGADVSGQAVAADLGRMPHLLIAGTTGSGKSVCVNAVINCLLLHNTPEQLKLIMVDPKRVELTNYNGIPHLIAPVVVDLERVVGVLQWVTREMDERYRRFAKVGARHIDDHNTRVAAKGEPRMPYIVVVIDELADLMMLSPEETERTICRLAQMARATGIHLIIATQRPSVDVITGLIKANFPARVAFAVASSVDSRVVLDGPGAERLLGRGDMLFMSPEAGQPLRLQGCWVSDREISRLVRYWKNARGLDGEAAAADAAGLPAPLVQPPLWDELRELENKAQEVSQGEDELLEDAVSVVRTAGKASISLLQRRLRIGYTRAARLIDLLEERGVVGPPKEGSTPREVLPPRAGEGFEGRRMAAPPGATPPGATVPGATPPGQATAAEPTSPPGSLRGHRPLGQNPPPGPPVDVPPWVD